jgi:hypothetical protein
LKNEFFLLIQKSPIEYPDEIINNTGFPLEFIPHLIRGGNDTFFQSVSSLPVIPAKLVLDSDRGAGIQELIDNLHAFLTTYSFSLVNFLF